MIKNLKIVAVLMAMSLFLPSCASIFSENVYQLSIDSAPSKANIVVKDRKGVEVYCGETPAKLDLKSGSGFFKKAKYEVTFTKNGYQSATAPIEFTLDDFYIGNVLLAGVLGMLIVDPITGAMFKLDTKFLKQTLLESGVSADEDQLKVYALDEIPQAWKDHLVVLDK
ncbi:MAG: hypothetical protein ACN4EF_02940 [Wenyingzhuangia sp.]|jgi:hypothetical protein|uniref:hypothetical protein n=1 Tax=Wenyingzhuangia sp. TaxID=1964193 RepID=UPI0032199804